MFTFAQPRMRRRPSLTPMIDVVFLLLVFFMLAARFGADATLPLSTAGADAPYEGPPRLVDVGTNDLRLNGQPVTDATLAAALNALMQSPEDTVLIRPRDGADVQALVRVLDLLRDAGLTRLVIVEAP
jgi:biopolymer transport protein ExbD